MKRKLLVSSLLALTAGQSFANAFQGFSDLAFDNPANYGLIISKEATMGSVITAPLIQTNGTSTPLGGSGNTKSTVGQVIPFGRFAMRVARPVVIGFDISTPWSSSLQYPQTSYVRYAATKADFQSFALTPTIAMNFSESFAIGAGLDFQYFGQTLAFEVPTGGGLGPNIPLTSTLNGWRTPWKVGAVYIYDKRAVFGLSYSNFVTYKLAGNTNFANFNTRGHATLPLPATISGDVKFAATKSIAVFGIAHYSLWNRLGTIVNHTGLPVPSLAQLPFTLNYTNSWFLLGGAQYIINPKFTVRGFGLWDQSPEDTTHRPVGLPVANVWGLGLGGDYHFTKTMSASFRYAHLFEHTHINNTNAAGIHVQGPMTINVDTFGLQFSYKA